MSVKLTSREAIASKNINGFSYNKLEDPDFIATTQKFKIFGLLETQHVSEDIDRLQIPDFKCFQVCRKKMKVGRKHGGIAVFIHKSVLGGITTSTTKVVLEAQRGICPAPCVL